jgi:thioredoxin-related protein
MIAYIATLIVGLVFLVTGTVKALSSRKFVEHISQYGIIPGQIIVPVGVIFIGWEFSLGAALILHVYPQWLVPGTLALLTLLSITIIWSTSSGRTEDCGCYGGLAIITPTQSILLNLGYISVMGLAWYYPVANYETATWKWILSLVLFVLALISAQKSINNPVVDLSYLKVGKQWQARWLENSSHDLTQGTHFIVFLGQQCPYCKRWVPLLNVMNAQSHLPNVTAVMTLNDTEIATFKAKHLVHFPVVEMNKLLFGYMAEAVPTAVLVEEGRVESVAIGEIPQKYSKEIQHFYRATIFNDEPKETARFAG